MSEAPFILLSNDDGVYSPALLALKQALADVGEVVVIAPERQWSAAGHGKTMHKPLRVTTVTLADGSEALASNGSPSDCVALAMLGLLKRQPSLVVSGINLGPNLGHDLIYSGTVSAAREGAIFGAPAIAASLAGFETPNPDALRVGAAFVADLAQRVMARGLPQGMLLNVNIPNSAPADMRGVAITRMGKSIYKDVLIERADPRGRAYYWIGGDPPTGEPTPGTDFGAVAAGMVSVTPVQLDMTDSDFLDRLRGWDLSLHPEILTKG
ncbi:MAG: 5'/3'-nucleotidase SurE [Anaerolineae bacterium]